MPIPEQVNRVRLFLRQVGEATASTDLLIVFGSVAAVCLSSALLTLAPVVFSQIFSDGATSSSTLLILVAFISTRAVGQALFDLRWLALNPLYYRISYRAASHSCETMVDKCALFDRGSNKIAEVSERVVAIQKAQLSIFSVVYNLGSVITPTLIDVVFVSAALYLTIGIVAVIILVISVILFLLTTWILNKEETFSFEQAAAADNLVYREMGQIVGLSKLIVEFSCFQFFRQRLDLQIRSSLSRHKTFFKIKSIRALLRTVSSSSAYVLVVIYLYFAIETGATLSPKQIFLFVSYFERTMSPLAAISVALTGIQNTLAVIGLGADAPAHLNPCTPVVEVGALGHKLSVCISSETGPTIFTLGPGDLVKVVGPSGSGKTTLLHTLFGAFRHKWSGAVSYLSDKPLIIEGSVLDNIRLGTESIDEIEIHSLWGRLGRSSVDMRRAADTISAGEMQTLAICRAISRNPDLFIIDEAMSAMDCVSESRAFETLREVCPQAILIILAHRTAIEQEFDVEVFVDGGRAQVRTRTGVDEALSPFGSQ